MPDFNGSFVNMSQYCMNVPMAEKVNKSNFEHIKTLQHFALASYETSTVNILETFIYVTKEPNC